MTEVEQCFGNIIGCKKSDDSDSGLYITDLEALTTLDGLVDGEDHSDIDGILEDAKRIGILTLNADLTAKYMRYGKKTPTFRSKVGSSSPLRKFAADGKKGMRIFCNPIKHAELHIYYVGFIGGSTGQVEIRIESNTDIDETIPIDAVKGKLVKFPTDLSFPIYNTYEKNVIFDIYHEGESYYTNRVQCAGCRPFYYNEDYPKYPYGKYAMIGSDKGENNMNGLVLGVEFRCRVDKAICDESIDFNTNPMAQSFAQAIQLKAGSVVLWKIIRTSKLNRVLMQDIENFREAATYYERKYRDLIKEIGKTMPIDGCFCEKGFTDVWVGKRR